MVTLVKPPISLRHSRLLALPTTRMAESAQAMFTPHRNRNRQLRLPGATAMLERAWRWLFPLMLVLVGVAATACPPCAAGAPGVQTFPTRGAEVPTAGLGGLLIHGQDRSRSVMRDRCRYSVVRAGAYDGLDERVRHRSSSRPQSISIREPAGVQHAPRAYRLGRAGVVH